MWRPGGGAQLGQERGTCVGKVKARGVSNVGARVGRGRGTLGGKGRSQVAVRAGYVCGGKDRARVEAKMGQL